MRKNSLRRCLSSIRTRLEHSSCREETVLSMVLVVIVLFGGVFAVLVIENFSAFAAVTRLSFFLWQTPPLPVGLWLLISCLFGACMLYIASPMADIQDRRVLRILRRCATDIERRP